MPIMDKIIKSNHQGWQRCSDLPKTGKAHLLKNSINRTWEIKRRKGKKQAQRAHA